MMTIPAGISESQHYCHSYGLFKLTRSFHIKFITKSWYQLPRVKITLEFRSAEINSTSKYLFIYISNSIYVRQEPAIKYPEVFFLSGNCNCDSSSHG